MIALESIYAVVPGAKLESLGLRSRVRTAFGTKRTSRAGLAMSVDGGRPEVALVASSDPRVCIGEFFYTHFPWQTAGNRRQPGSNRGIHRAPVARGCAPRPLLPAANALLNIGRRSARANVARAG